MIDKNSMKIIIELSRDGSLSNIELAKRLGISVLTVGKKKRKLIADGILKINAKTNPWKMGYELGAFFGLGVDQKCIDRICDELTHISNISLVVTCFGRFDIIIVANFIDLRSFQNFVKSELSRITGINHVEIYFIDRRESYTKPAQLDEMDKLIIKEIVDNAEATHAGLAKKLGMNQSTVTRRISSLVKQNVIRYHAVTDPSQLGYTANAFVFIQAEMGKVDKIISKLFKLTEVNSVFRLMNNYEILFDIHSRNLEELYGFIKTEVVNIDGVSKTETFVRGFFHHFKSASLFIPPV